MRQPLAIGALALGLALPACSQSPLPEPHATPAPTVDALPPSPVRGGHNGLEVRFLPVIEESLVQAELERIAANAVPIPHDAQQNWSAAGLRIYALPATEIDRFMTVMTSAPADRLQGATPMASVTKVWVPQGPLWMEAVRGPAASAGRTIALHDSRLAIGAAPVRLLARAWTVPVPPASVPGQGESEQDGRPTAAVHVEVIPQALDDAGRVRADPLRPSLRPGEETRGLMLARLQLAATLPPGLALVVTTDPPPPEPAPTPESGEADAAPNGAATGIGSVERRPPGSETSSTAAPPNERAVIGGASPPPSAAPSGAGPTVGPAAGPVPTLGEALLVYPVPGDRRRRRAVVLFIPHAPEHFSLIGRPAN